MARGASGGEGDDEDGAGPPQSLLRRLRWLLLGTGGFVLLWAALVAGNSLGRYFGWIVPAGAPASLAEALRPHYRIERPEGPGLFPTALLFSGCDGPHDNMRRWAEALASLGWASVTVDSHAPRDFIDSDVWRLICAGQLLMGSERAGDVLVSLYDVRRMDFVDPERLVLVGASHGGWAVMELLVFEKLWRLPYNLASLPQDEVAHPLQGVAGVILVYPYCGAANRASRTGWRLRAPALFLLAEFDTIAPADDCLAVAERLAAEGIAVETRVFEGATHGFDQEERAALSLLEFDPEATVAALEAAAGFLASLPPAPAPSEAAAGR